MRRVGGAHRGEVSASEIGAAAPGDHGAHARQSERGRHERGGGAGAGPEEADREVAGGGVVGQPVDDAGQAAGEQVDIEAQRAGAEVDRLLVGGEQVDQEGGEAGLAQHAGDEAVAGAEAATAAAVGEEDDAGGVGGPAEGARQPHAGRGDDQIALVDCRGRGVHLSAAVAGWGVGAGAGGRWRVGGGRWRARIAAERRHSGEEREIDLVDDFGRRGRDAEARGLLVGEDAEDDDDQRDGGKQDQADGPGTAVRDGHGAPSGPGGGRRSPALPPPLQARAPPTHETGACRWAQGSAGGSGCGAGQAVGGGGGDLDHSVLTLR